MQSGSILCETENKEALVVLGRGRYQTEACQMIRTWGQFYLEGIGGI